MPGAIGSDVAIALSAGGSFFADRPGDEAAVARALHADAPIAPWLLSDPVDHGARVVAVRLERRARASRRVAG